MRRATLFWLPWLASAQSWVAQTSGVAASLRGVGAVNARVAWASGTGGAWLRTEDGGATWKSGQVPGAETLDFRDLHAVDARSAYLMSIGPGAQSRVYKTGDGGLHWKLLFTNPDERGFFDAIAFWNPARGILLGDAVDAHMTVFTTEDAGEHWTRRQTPAALEDEGAFAASGTCLIVGPSGRSREAWFGTGGRGAARVFHSADGGRSWKVAATPIRNDSASAGIFSLVFSNSRYGVAVGGDYSKPAEAAHNIAITTDGGRTWGEPTRQPQGAPPAGFRSAVVYLADARAWIATGTSGSDISTDGGRTWRSFDAGAFNALAFASREAGWAVGPRGRIAAIRWNGP